MGETLSCELLQHVSSSLPGHYVPGILAQTFLLEPSLKGGETDGEDRQLELSWENCMTQ